MPRSPFKPLQIPLARLIVTVITIPVITLLMIAVAMVGCAAPEVPLPTTSEPTDALRSPDLRGLILEDARITDYDLEARLDTETHQVAGKARITWRNTSEHGVDTLPFHLYMNGFRAEDTAWMQSSRGRHRRGAHPGG